MQEYVETFSKCGLTITGLFEPCPTDEQAEISVNIAWLKKITAFKILTVHQHHGTQDDIKGIIFDFKQIIAVSYIMAYFKFFFFCLLFRKSVRVLCIAR